MNNINSIRLGLKPGEAHGPSRQDYSLVAGLLLAAVLGTTATTRTRCDSGAACAGGVILLVLIGCFARPPAFTLFLAASKSTVASPAFSAFSVAFWAIRLATGLNSARPIRFSKSAPGEKRMFTALMFLDVNFSMLSVPSLLMEIPKVPSSPSWILLPLSSCSTRHSAHIGDYAFHRTA